MTLTFQQEHSWAVFGMPELLEMPKPVTLRWFINGKCYVVVRGKMRLESSPKNAAQRLADRRRNAVERFLQTPRGRPLNRTII